MTKNRYAKHDDAPLGPSERKILLGISHGYTTKEMSQKLFLSTDTIRSHIERIFRYYKVHSRAEAVHEALRRGDIK